MTATTAPRAEHDHILTTIACLRAAGAKPDTGRHYEAMVAELCQRWNVDPREAARIGESFQCG